MNKLHNIAKQLLLATGILTIIACTGGGDGGSPDPKPEPQPFIAKPIPYNYTANYTTGQTVMGGYTDDCSKDGITPCTESSGLGPYPVVDMRPFGQQVRITYTITNPYESTPIWIVKPLLPGGVQSNFNQSYNRYSGWMFQGLKFSGTCLDTNQNTPLQSNQSCTIIMNINQQFNYTESELINIAGTMYWRDDFKFTYFHLDSNGDPQAVHVPLNTYIRAGIWYHDKPGYDLGLVQGVKRLTSFNVKNINGTDYIFPTENVNSQPFRVIFTGGIAQVDTANPVNPCPVAYCQNNIYITPTMYNVGYYQGALSMLTGGNPSNGSNVGRAGLNNVEYGRTGDTGVPNVSLLFAVQQDGTVIGKNATTGKFGCFNNNGTNFREMVMPANTSFFDPILQRDVGYSVFSTISFESTNWIQVYDSTAGTSSLSVWIFYKVLASPTICGLDANNVITNIGAVMAPGWSSGGVSQQLQITPNGIYTVVGQEEGYLSKMQFYKYPPRQ